MILALLLSMNLASAQEVGVNVNKIDASGEDTTISIRKGKAASAGTALFEIVENKEEVAGEPAALLKQARTNWKTACADWKKETKENNKENSILVMNCGSMKCTTDKMESTCISEALVKLKVKVSQ